MLERADDFYYNAQLRILKERMRLLRLSQAREKSGHKSFKMASWKKYRKEVWFLTKEQPLHELEGFEKRDFFKYHLDHIVSVYDGYLNSFPAKWIASISNLRIVPKEVNDKKGRKSLPDALNAMIHRLKTV